MSAVLYYSGNIEAAKAVAPEGKVRFSNAKYFDGQLEYAGTKKVPSQGVQPIYFDKVFIAPGCLQGDAIAKAYAAVDIPVEVLAAPAKGEAPAPAPPASVKTAKDLGWTMKTAPDKYLKKYPKGAKADLAREVLAELGKG